MKMPCRWQRSSKKRMKPSPCEWQRKSDSLPTASRYLATEKKGLGPEEPAIGNLRQPARTQCLRKLAAHHLGRLGMVDRPVALAAAGVVIAGEHRDPLEQGGFAAAVFTDDDGDRPVETQLEVIVQEWQTERIGGAVWNARRLKP